jgi:hypothetical protein
VVREIGCDRRLKFGHALEDATADGVLGNQGEEPLDQIEPRRRGRDEVQFEAPEGLDAAPGARQTGRVAQCPLTRLVGQWLSERLGRPVIIDNRPGAATNIGTAAAARARADGYTLVLLGPPAAINATLYDNLKFNVLRDIAPVASLARAPNVLEVALSVPAKTVPEFIAYAKANPGKLNMASSGVGTSLHMSGELFKMEPVNAGWIILGRRRNHKFQDRLFALDIGAIEFLIGSEATVRTRIVQALNAILGAHQAADRVSHGSVSSHSTSRSCKRDYVRSS